MRSAASPPAAKLDRQPPEQYTSRGEFDQAVDAEGEQRNAVGPYGTADCDDSLDRHPGEGGMFQTEGMSNRSGPVGAV
jgi:hypothetical protein